MRYFILNILPKPGELVTWRFPAACASDRALSWDTGASGNSPPGDAGVIVYLWVGDTLRLVDEAGGGRPDTDNASSAVAAAKCAIDGTTEVSIVAKVDAIP